MTSLQQIFCILAILCSTSLLAQDQMERLYRSNRQNTALDVALTSDEGYLILSAGREPDSTEFDFYNLTKLDNKGNLAWSRDYQFEEKIEPSGSLTLLDSDSFLVAGSLINTPGKYRFFMKGDPSGNIVSTKGYENGTGDNLVFLYQTPVDTSYRNGFYTGGIYTNGAGTLRRSYLGETDAEGNYLWSKTYTNPTHDPLNIEKIRATRDSGLIACGVVSETLPVPDFFLMKTDSLGEIQWSRKYGDLFGEGASTVTQTPDDGYLVGGSGGAVVADGILIKTDTIGQVEWASNIDFGLTDGGVAIHDIMIASDGNAVIAGTVIGTIAMDENFAFMIKINMAGDVIWQRKYKSSTDTYKVTGLKESPIGGYVFITTSEENDEQVGPYLIKTNDVGETLCDSVIMDDLLVPITIPVDSLANVAADDSSNIVEVLVADTLNYGGFNPPTVTLPSFQFCPDSIFAVVFDATVDGAIAYEWSTGETTPTITVTDFGEYMVTVTVGEDYCYILCTSAAISEIAPPEVGVQINDGDYCNTGLVTLFASVTGDDIVSFEWSTGETEQSIQVDVETNYSVTVTNSCGDTASDEVNLIINNTPPTIDVTGTGTFCATGQETLIANVPPEYVNSISWSTGETGQSIDVDEDMIYTATVSTNFCGDNSADYNVNTGPPSISITGTGTYCETGADTLIAIVPPQYLGNITWSPTGETTPSIIADGEGTYTATVSSFCGENSINYEIMCDEIVEVPNAFTPNNDDINDTFIPEFSFNPGDFVEYRFAVYNRWGEKVFETSNPNEGWDGTVDGENAVADVYMWTLEGRTINEYDIEPEDRAGDVTLIR